MRKLKLHIGSFEITFHYWTWVISKGKYLHVPIFGLGFGKNGGIIQILFTSLGIAYHGKSKNGE